MCGITGFFSPGRKQDCTRFYDSHLLIRHRGPDDEGFVAWDGRNFKEYRGDDSIGEIGSLSHIRTLNSSSLVMGHRRLSIIDLSPHGHQPFLDENRDLCMVYNGEIFNYIELRADLEKAGYRFRSHSDTEVVLNAFRHWGTDAFNRLNGMWALAIFDRREHRLILSRDRFGIKPLYYALRDGILYFASEMKFIRSFADISFTVNRKSCALYLDTSRVTCSDRTFWNEISELEPARYLVLDDGGIRIRKYWDFRPRTEKLSDAEALEKFRFLFEDSLRLRMRSDVEVGTLLSGGLDSTLIDCNLSRLGFLRGGTFKSFSAVFEDARFSEKPYIDETLKTISVQPFFVRPEARGVSDALPRLLHHIEEPFRSLSVYSQFLLYDCIRSRSGVKVVLNGQGADELFGGYQHHYYRLFASQLKTFKWVTMAREIGLFLKFRKPDAGEFLVKMLKEVVKSLGHGNHFSRASFRELQTTALREYLKYDDRNSMAFGIEARVPFLDYRLVEFAFSLPDNLKIRNFSNKYLERKYASGLVPGIIIDRTDKMGFISPQELWQKREMKSEWDGAFQRMRKTGLLDIRRGESLHREYRDYVSGKNRDWARIWRYYCLDRWLHA